MQPQRQEKMAKDLRRWCKKNDVGHGVAVANDGSIYVVGNTTVNSPYDDIWIRKYKQ
jgi:hypothetical protein